MHITFKNDTEKVFDLNVNDAEGAVGLLVKKPGCRSQQGRTYQETACYANGQISVRMLHATIFIQQG